MDLAFAMHHMFLKHLMEAMFDNRDQLISKAKHLGSVSIHDIVIIFTCSLFDYLLMKLKII